MAYLASTALSTDRGVKIFSLSVSYSKRDYLYLMLSINIVHS